MADRVHRMPPFLNTTREQTNISHVGRPPWSSGSAAGARPPWLSRGTEGGVYTTVKYLNLIGNPLLYKMYTVILRSYCNRNCYYVTY